ncbi:MAG: efflux RND transporter permease subunit [Algisphaera sp.]
MTKHSDPYSTPGSAPGSDSLVQRIVEMFLGGNLAVMLIIGTLIAGGAALMLTPREEEPQIVVPLADVVVNVPGASAREVERQVATSLERLLYQIDGVEYVYSVSRANQALITVRFYVGEDREDSLVKLHNKLVTSTDQVPDAVSNWLVRPIEVDDVPIVNMTLYADDAQHNDADLYRMAQELETTLQAVPDVGRTYLIGGRPRQISVQIDPQRLSGRGLSWAKVRDALRDANITVPAGSVAALNSQRTLEAGGTLSTAHDVARLVVATDGNHPIYLRDIATVTDGPAEPTHYTTLSLPERDGQPAATYSAVTVAVAKKNGTNAVWVSRAVEKAAHDFAQRVLPQGIHVRMTHDSGETANEKVNELVASLVVAVIIVIGLLTAVMGWRAALVVALAVPLTFGLTMLFGYAAGYTINRVTLFALILALGLVVDDPIVDVENVHRHLALGKQKPRDAVLTAINEVRPPIILATLAVIVSFIPISFVTGMMGAYMGPMAINVPASMLASMVVAFTVTPWLAYHALRSSHEPHEGDTPPSTSDTPTDANDAVRKTTLYRLYASFMVPLLDRRRLGLLLLFMVSILFVLSLLPAVLGGVPLKMLPYNNRDALQVVVDLPEGSTLEATAACTDELTAYFQGLQETVDVTTYTGTASPIDFNGLVRHYFLRQGPHMADLRINLLPAQQRAMKSHGIALRVRGDLEAIAKRHGALAKIVETPPGPPVIATLTAEVYGPDDAPYADLQRVAKHVAHRFGQTPGVVDIDTSVEADPPKWTFVVDKEKAALAGLSTQTIADEIAAAVSGEIATYLHVPNEAAPLPVELRLPVADRHRRTSLNAMRLPTDSGESIPLSELGNFVESTVDQPIYRKNLRPVAYVFADTAGITPVRAVLDMFFDLRPDQANGLPSGYHVNWVGEGELKITALAFRDMGIAFAVACLAIYVLLVYETASFLMPLILMIAIPLTLIGVMPGFWFLNLITGSTIGGYSNPVYFTATAMIGVIALAGITVRNAILLIDFTRHAVADGMPLRNALLTAGAVRIRPIFLTGATAMLAAIPITFDPVFSGLAWALIFGLTVSTALTLVVIPVTYALIYGEKKES